MKPTYDTLNDNITSRYSLLTLRRPTVKFAVENMSWQQKLSLYWQLYRTRKQLARLTRLQLHDIGLTADQAKQEAAKPFWRI